MSCQSFSQIQVCVMPTLPANAPVWGSGSLEWAKEGANSPHQEIKIHRVTTTSVVDPGHMYVDSTGSEWI